MTATELAAIEEVIARAVERAVYAALRDMLPRSDAAIARPEAERVAQEPVR
jgi:hypothetical protein